MPVAVGCVVALVVKAVGVLLLELVVVTSLFVVGVEMLVPLLAAAGLLSGVADFTIALVFVGFVVVRLQRRSMKIFLFSLVISL